MKIAPGFKFASRTGERCTRNAAVVEQRNGTLKLTDADLVQLKDLHRRYVEEG